MTATLKFLFVIIASLLATAGAFHVQPQRWSRTTTALRAVIDDAKIKDAAGHFGKYSVKEIEEIKNELHKERVQSLLFDSAVSDEKAKEQRLMEANLDLQLALLKKATKTDSSLFPDEMVKDLPHLKSGSVAANMVQPKDVYFQEAFLDENVLETIAFCSVLAIVMVVPQLLH